jgi:SMP-30/Gluconolactonase/LRE-like region
MPVRGTEGYWRGRSRATLALIALTVAMLGLPAVLAIGARRARSIAARTHLARAAGSCRLWHAHQLLSGQGWLEDLEFDGHGGMTISALVKDRILRLSGRGRLSTLVAGISAPGGQRRIGHNLYFTTGDSVPVTSNGTIDRLDLQTGKHYTWARGLTMPNALVFLGNGDAVVSRDVGTGTGLTRVPAKGRRPETEWARIDDTNGLAVDPSGRWLYTDRTFSSDGEVDRVSIANPRRIQVVARLGAGVAADDMTVDQSGILYIAGFGSGKIYRLDTTNHRFCAIATGLTQPTSVRLGGVGWHRSDLYVTDAAGHLSELKPPHRH